MLPVNSNISVSQIMPIIPIMPKQSEEVTYSLESLRLHEIQQVEVTYTLKSIEFTKGIMLNISA